MNLKLDRDLVREVEKLVEQGYFSSKTEAFTCALKFLIRHFRAEELRRRIDEIREGTGKLPSATMAVVDVHEEEDEC